LPGPCGARSLFAHRDLARIQLRRARQRAGSCTKSALNPTVFGEKSTILYRTFTVAFLSVRRLLAYRSHCQRLAEPGAYSRTKNSIWSMDFGDFRNRNSMRSVTKSTVNLTAFRKKSTIFYKNFTVALLDARRLLGYRSHCQRLAELGAYSRTKNRLESSRAAPAIPRGAPRSLQST
jgi:hypothetical protein